MTARHAGRQWLMYRGAITTAAEDKIGAVRDVVSLVCWEKVEYL